MRDKSRALERIEKAEQELSAAKEALKSTLPISVELFCGVLQTVDGELDVFIQDGRRVLPLYDDDPKRVVRYLLARHPELRVELWRGD